MLRFAALLLFLPAALWAEQFSGRIHVIDGDTFDVADIRVRLHGVDAVEKDQTCVTQDGRRWACGAWVVTQVTDRFEGRMATCLRVDTDRYGRAVAKCDVGGQDLGEVLVNDGLVQAYRRYSMDYDLDEKAAQVRGVGLWSSSTMVPAEFRQTTQTTDTPPPNASCVIKGNISNAGRIYHLPGQENYADTRIESGSGERWFCSEREAVAAGWRRARR